MINLGSIAECAWQRWKKWQHSIIIKKNFKHICCFCSHPHSSLVFIHHSIKEEDQSDACWGEGLHPAFQDIQVLLPLAPTQPVLTRVPVVQTGHAVHNKCGAWKKKETATLIITVCFICCNCLSFVYSVNYEITLLNIFIRASSLIMVTASMLLFSSTTDWPFLVYTQETSRHMIRSTLITGTQSISLWTSLSFRNLTPKWDSAVRCETWRRAISFRSAGTHAWGQQRSRNPWRPLTPISAKIETQWQTRTEGKRAGREFTRVTRMTCTEFGGSWAVMMQRDVDPNGVFMMVLVLLQCTHEAQRWEQLLGSSWRGTTVVC